MKRGFSDSQSRDVDYIGRTGVECRVCKKSNMMVKVENSDSSHGTINQQLECPNCGEHYPRVISLDKTVVIHSPFNDLEKV